MNDPKIILALDFSTRNEVDALVEKLDPALCRLKVGKELFTRCGPELVRDLVSCPNCIQRTGLACVI